MLVQNTPKVTAPPASADAVLSQSPPQPVDDFAACEFEALDQVHDHPHVGHYRRMLQTRFVEYHVARPHFRRRRRFRRTALSGRQRLLAKVRRRREIGWRRSGWNLRVLAAGVETLLPPSSLGGTIVRGTPLVRTLPAMVLSAPERTAQVPPACVAGMRQKANPAVDAVHDALLKFGMRHQHRVKRRLILPNKRLGAIVLMPIRAKREKLVDRDDKKTKLSVIMEIALHTPSSYLIDANASRGRARFFVRNGRELAAIARANDPSLIANPSRSACPVGIDSLRLRP